MAFLKNLGGGQPDYVLNGLLRVGGEPYFKTAVILGVAANQPYEFIRDKPLMVLPHPAQGGGGGGGNMQNSAHNASTICERRGKSNDITNSSNRSGGQRLDSSGGIK